MSRLSMTKPQLGAAAAVLLLVGAGGGYGLSRLNSPDPKSATAVPGDRKVLYWYDPMVPGQRFEKPGKSPFMDMQLVPRYADEAQAEAGVSIDPARIQALARRLDQAGVSGPLHRQELRLGARPFGHEQGGERRAGADDIARRTSGDRLHEPGGPGLHDRDITAIEVDDAGNADLVPQ